MPVAAICMKRFAAIALLMPGVLLANAAAGGTCAYVANSGSNDVTVIETMTHTPLKTIPVGMLPRALALSSDGTRVYVANGLRRTISVIDTTSLTEVKRLAASLANLTIIK